MLGVWRKTKLGNKEVRTEKKGYGSGGSVDKAEKKPKKVEVSTQKGQRGDARGK